jgi:hypothetical protein
MEHFLWPLIRPLYAHCLNTLSIASFALTPKGVLAATAALNISPVAKWHKQYSSLIRGDCVPLPDPGGPKTSGEPILKRWNKDPLKIKSHKEDVES